MAMGKKTFMDKRQLFTSGLNVDLWKRIINRFVWSVVQYRVCHTCGLWQNLTRSDWKQLKY